MLEFQDSPEPDEFVREKGRKLFSGNVDFLKGVVDMNGLPPADRLEVCFAGRPNFCVFLFTNKSSTSENGFSTPYLFT